MGFVLPILSLPLCDCLGWFFALIALWSLSGHLYPLYPFLKSLLPRGSLAARYGHNSWAVVTGPSQGIGREFCEVLARERLNIVLVSRGEAGGVARELEAKYGVKTKVVRCDLEGSGKGVREKYEGVWRQIGDLDVSVLVNNAGVAFDGLFSSQPIPELVKLLEVNVWPIVIFSRFALERMRSRKMRSAIINVSSVCALCPYAGFSLYCATKKFDDFLSITLANEAEIDPELKIDVLSLRPSYVQTALLSGLKVPPEQSSIASVESCVKGALDMLGRGKYTAGAFKHTVETVKMVKNNEEKESKGYLAALPFSRK